MAETSSIVGIALMVIGGVFVAIGAILCYVTKVRRDTYEHDVISIPTHFALL